MRNFFIILLFFVSASLHADETCMDSIKEKNHKRFVEKCFISDRTMKENILFNYKFQHKFGSEKNPSKEARYLKLEALKGDPAAQFLWALVQGVVYKNKNEWKKWLYKSAEQSYESAMIRVVDGYFIPHVRPENNELKERVIKYLKILVRKKHPDSEKLLKLAMEKRSKEELLDNYQLKSEQYKALISSEIMEIANALKFGFYREGNGLQGINIEKDIKKSIEILNYLKNERQFPTSGYHLGTIWENRNIELVVKNYIWSATKGDDKSAAWLGEYYGCLGEKAKARFWLKKASKLGHKFASLILNEINEYGYPVSCDVVWMKSKK